MKEKLFLFLILFFVIFIINYPVRTELSNGVNFVDFSSEKQLPPYIKGIYATAWTASSEVRMDELIKLVKETELNAIIIDIKEVEGRVYFDTDSSLINELGSEKVRIPKLKELIDKLHKENIYAIARIVIFKDNYMPKVKPEWALKNKNGGIWRDWAGNSWLNMASTEVWDYNVELAKEVIKIGFDEINFDYIRFPTDGSISQIKYSASEDEFSRPEIIRDFFKYINLHLNPFDVFLSADLFGLTMLREDDMNIGQILEYALPYFDFIAPMVYPSHYPAGFEGYENPAEYPYEVLKVNLEEGRDRVSLLKAEDARGKIRPWLQDFSLGAFYGEEKIKLQKQAVYDTDSYGWLLWNASSRYTEGGLERR